MQLEQEIHRVGGFANLELLATQIVEGFISGMHRSPFHGFSAEFAEHKVYNSGESTRHIDWKLFAKTDKLFTKRYEEETNLRCHVILDNSASMHFPLKKDQALSNLNKIGFSVLATACLMQILKKQRDAVGLSIYSDQYEYYAPEKGSERHRRMLLHKLEDILKKRVERTPTNTYTYLHQIAEKMKRRSLIFFFSDLFQEEVEEEELFTALRHLKYNKHELVLFHVLDRKRELDFEFGNTPQRFTDVETGEKIDLYAENVKEGYRKTVSEYFDRLQLKCLQYGIKYVQADTNEDFQKILSTYLVERQKFV
ncbi:DUF58 domain-containing protein [Salinimicrobium oceani]|uniref:DUF58 domain-containing protein n=1 Tax=Salinimicrobium oceani TaxID=2722702 RepID=A0ABX1CXQ8_9FLAO|nr:DUF58 domain-containing protein [Salinimicrobium oceani]NJW53043.1 DUF58 domain-containing protein [Salinimicrobium oceani]